VVQRGILLCFAVGLASFTAGCASSPTVVAKGRVDVPPQPDVARVNVTAKVNNLVVIGLPPIAASDREWTIVLNDARFLPQQRPIERKGDGSAVATFLAVREGRRMIRFFALPPNDREAVPSQSYEAVVEIE
jgi:hypothetical protein